MESKAKVIACVINDLHYDQRMIRICGSLQRGGYDVCLVGRKKSSAPLQSREFNQHRFNLIFKGGPLFYFFYNLRLFLYLLLHKVDVIHAVDLDTLIAASWARRLKGCKLVYDAHEYFTEVPELLDRPRVQAFWKKVERRFVPRADLHLTVGEQLAQRFEKQYKRHFVTVRNTPVSSTSMSKQSLSAYPFILYQGALNKGRGLELLIDAMSEVDLHLIVVGSGDLDERLKSMVHEKQLEDKVHFTGMLPPEEMKAYTEQAYLGYNLSEDLGLSYHYSLNNKYFDYIHAGLPAITNDFPEYRALNEHYPCCHLIAHEKVALISAIKLLLNDQEYYQKLKKSCLIAKEALNWEQEELKLLQSYEQLS